MKETAKKVINKKAEVLDNVVGSLMKIGLPLMKNVLISSTKSVLIPLGLTVAAWGIDAGI